LGDLLAHGGDLIQEAGLRVTRVPALGIGDGDVSKVSDVVPEGAELFVEASDPQSAGAHVHASVGAPKVDGDAEDLQVKRLHSGMVTRLHERSFSAFEPRRPPERTRQQAVSPPKDGPRSVNNERVVGVTG
jgi:hypothetical protein